MKFPGLNLGAISSANNITSAYVEIRDMMCETTNMTVYGYIFDGNEWSESTANWSNVDPNSWTEMPNAYTDVCYSNGAAKNPAHRYSIDITQAVKSWKTGFYSQSKGIMLRASDSVESGSALYKTFASYNRASNKPSLKVNYTEPVLPTGSLENVSGGVISGWAWRSDIPNTAINVKVDIINVNTNVKETYQLTANILRQDLVDAGYGNGRHGFSMNVNWSSLAPGRYVVRAYGVQSNGTSYTELQNSSINVDVVQDEEYSHESRGVCAWITMEDIPPIAITCTATIRGTVKTRDNGTNKTVYEAEVYATYDDSAFNAFLPEVDFSVGTTTINSMDLDLIYSPSLPASPSNLYYISYPNLQYTTGRFESLAILMIHDAIYPYQDVVCEFDF